MSYQEEEGSRMRRQAASQAIALAMQGHWEEALAANKSLLESFPNDVDAYNRLGRAHMELGEYAQARASYEKALQLDPYNTIAKKNLNRLSHLEETAVSSEGGSKVEPQQFIEEVGKAGVVHLYRLAPPPVLARTVAGARVNLRVEGSGLSVENGRGEYLGQVEPRHGQRIARLMERGNRYTAAIISSTDEAVKLIIREIYQHPSQVGRLSFPPKGSEGFRPYAGSRIGDRIIRREIEYEEALPGETSYTIIGGDEGEEADLLAEDAADADDEVDNE